MEGLLSPTHLIFVVIIVGIICSPRIIKIIEYLRATPQSTGPHPVHTETEGGEATTSMKYCADCGKQILRRAEICPHCGCRQLPPR
jgi:hypothetical protein